MDKKNVKRLSVTLPDEFVAGLEDAAEDMQVSLAEAIRHAVATYLIEHYWNKTIGQTAEEAIRAGATNEEALQAVKALFPDAATSMESISWYRSKLRKEDDTIPTDRQARERKRGG